MPLSCALYPLGHFMKAEQADVDYFTVDAEKCEGVGKVGTRQPELSVKDYADRNSLDNRLEAADSFRGLVTAWACSGIEQSTQGPQRACDVLAADPQARLPIVLREELAVLDENMSDGVPGVPALLAIDHTYFVFLPTL